MSAPKKFVYINAILLSIIITPAFTQNAIKEFNEAWENPVNTHYEAPPANINILLSLPIYESFKNIQLTGTQLWEAEKKKAWAPKTYIPHAVIDGASYNKSQPSEGEKIFMRASEQRSWLNPDVIVAVLEEVHIFENLRKVIFLGKTIDDLLSNSFCTSQPLFHVEHSVGGTEENPLSLWRIIMLTDDAKYVKAVEKMFTQSSTPRLPIFVEKYLINDLGIIG